MFFGVVGKLDLDLDLVSLMGMMLRVSRGLIFFLFFCGLGRKRLGVLWLNNVCGFGELVDRVRSLSVGGDEGEFF